MKTWMVLFAIALCGAATFAREPPPPPENVTEALTQLRRECAPAVDALRERLAFADAERFPGIRAWTAEVADARGAEAGELDVEELTTRNPGFWAAVYELYPDDPMFLALVAGLRNMGGEVYRAQDVIRLGACSPGRPEGFRVIFAGLGFWMDRLTELTAVGIREGIRRHDAGDFDGAIAKYRAVIAEWPQEGWAHYELGQSLCKRALAEGSGEVVVDPDAPHAAEYALCRRYRPLEKMAWQGAGPQLMQRCVAMWTRLAPAWAKLAGGSADVETATEISEAAQACELHDLALFARQLRVALNVGYQQSDREFIARSLRALVPGEATERTIARLNGEPAPIHSFSKFAGEPPVLEWRKP